MHPNGPNAKGQPVLIQPQPDGSAKVIGGVGGKLNHLRLTGVRAQTSYTETLRARAKERREAKRRQAERDKALGLQKVKAEAHRKVTEKSDAAQHEFVQAVASAMGWKPESYTFDPAQHADKAEHVIHQLQRAHLREMVKRAEAAVHANRERILIDADARAQADLGEVPLSSDKPETLSVQDLDPVRAGDTGLGFATDYKGRAERAGADVQAEAAEMREPLTDAQRKAAIKRGETAQIIGQEMGLLRDPERQEALGPKLVEAKEALDLMKAEKKMKMAVQQARKARREIEESVEEPKAFVLEVDDAKVDAAVADEVANDLRTIATRQFLAEVNDTAPDAMKALRKHVGSGAYNSINALALAAGGAALVDRSVVDVLGVAGAAQVLARRLRADLSPDEFADIADGMGEFHLKHYMATTEEALGRARELKDRAAEIELGAAETGGDLATMQEMNRRRAAAIREAQQTLGTALGEMEANAALVYALGQEPDDKPFEVSLGDISVESAVQQVRAIGLQRGDYSLEKIGGNRVLTVTPEGMARLAQPVDRADLEQVRRNLDILEGLHDEDGWLPKGVADRPDLDLHAQPGAAPRMAIPFEPGENLEADLKAYIGSRAADGDLPADIVSDLQSATFFQKVGDRAEAYRAAIDKLAPLTDADGKLRQAADLADAFDAMADEFVANRYGGARMPINRQTFGVDETSVDALHRALAAEPTGKLAYKPVGDLTRQDQGALREFFAKNVAKESPEAAGWRRDLEAHMAAEPERETEDMFGERSTNPAWSQWAGQRDELQGKLKNGHLDWPTYVKAMGGPTAAYAAVQDIVKSKVSKGFADAYNTLKPGALKVGRTTIAGNLNHLDAVDPAARDARMAREREMADSLRNRVAGRYAAGGVREKMQAAREEQAGLEAAQMSFFAAEPEPAKETPLGADERYTLGHEAERQIAALMPKVGENFKPGEAVKMFRPSMSGPKNAPRQRAIKLIEANKRVILSAGTGSGKTLIGLGGFTHLQQQGKAKRGQFIVPSIAQGGFGADALRFLEPGKFKWHAQPGASREERIAAYKDPENHFCVMTHQSFRDDMVHLAAKHAGVDEATMGAQVKAMSREERKAWAKELMDREGIQFDYLNVDEGHNLLDRQGKPDSEMANVIDAFSDNVPYYVNASADPVKNDVSEAFSLLQKMDPARYTDRAAFMRRYGVNTAAARDGLKRELARFQYPTKIDPEVTVHRSEAKIPLSAGQTKALADLDAAMAKARIASVGGKVDVDAVKAVSPGSFEGVPEDKHEAVAKALAGDLGLLKQTAIKRILDAHPENGKLDWIAQAAAERKGKQGIVFAHSLDAVSQIKARLESQGLRVATITGKDSAKVKKSKIDAYRPPNGESEVDIMVCSDAGATGANLQSGRWLANYDTPDTAMTHAQRNGRINRIGQVNDIELLDAVADHPEEEKRRKRLTTKYGLREIMTSPMESLDDSGLAFFLRRRQVARQEGGGDLFSA